MEENFIRTLQIAYAMHCWNVLQAAIQMMWDQISLAVTESVKVLRGLGLLDDE